MNKKETDELYYKITSNGCREMDEDRFYQAVNEAINIENGNIQTQKDKNTTNSKIRQQ